MAEKLFTHFKQTKLLIILLVPLIVFIIYHNTNTEFIKLPNIPFLRTTFAIPPAVYYKNITTTTHKKTILFWNTFFGVKDMYFGTGSAIFEHCTVNNCVATYNKSSQPVVAFDAIVFHGARYSVTTDRIPHYRSVHQKYIFYSLESPYNSHFDAIVNEHFYNWTMTYRRDSNIYSPYGLVVKSNTAYEIPDIKSIKARPKKVAWFVSNCKTKGSQRRLKYAQELSKYIPVDIYGTCGTLSCTDHTQCYQMLENDYKFYLSFENSMCEDYITEKLFNILQYNVVPIVLNYFDYTKLTPPNSVINTQNYASPAALAAYLWSLDNDPVAYLKFFEWKHEFRIVASTQHVLCQLCQLLHAPITYASYENIENWFYGFNCLI